MKVNDMKVSILFVLPLLILLPKCTGNEGKLASNVGQNISVSIDTIDNDIIIIDSIIDKQISIKRIYDNKLDLVHRYYNDTNKVFIYEFFEKDSVLLSIIREANKKEKVLGSNIMLLEKTLDYDTILTCKIYIALPFIADDVDLSFFELHENEVQQLFNKKITNPKNIIEANIDLSKSYYFSSTVTLNSGNTYEFIYNIDW